jgi:hypothetical protein
MCLVLCLGPLCHRATPPTSLSWSGCPFPCTPRRPTESSAGAQLILPFFACSAFVFPVSNVHNTCSARPHLEVGDRPTSPPLLRACRARPGPRPPSTPHGRPTWRPWQSHLGCQTPSRLEKSKHTHSSAVEEARWGRRLCYQAHAPDQLSQTTQRGTKGQAGSTQASGVQRHLAARALSTLASPVVVLPGVVQLGTRTSRQAWWEAPRHKRRPVQGRQQVHVLHPKPHDDLGPKLDMLRAPAAPHSLRTVDTGRKYTKGAFKAIQRA